MQNQTGAVFQPELIKLMRAVLDDAARTVPEGRRTPAVKTEIASQILACAAKGERSPEALRTAALSAVADCSNYGHEMSIARSAI